jgi:hypothetical protein
VRCMASTMPRAAMDLQLDTVWCGPFPEPARANAATDAALATMGYARTDVSADDAFARTLALVDVDGAWWIEADRRVAVALASPGSIDAHEIHVANRVDRDAHVGSVRSLEIDAAGVATARESSFEREALHRGDLITSARAALVERVAGRASTPRAITALRYVAAPLVGDAALDRIAYGLREAERYAVLVELEPVRVRAERLGGDVHELWVIPTGDDWERIDGVLRRPVNP